MHRASLYFPRKTKDSLSSSRSDFNAIFSTFNSYAFFFFSSLVGPTSMISFSSAPLNLSLFPLIFQRFPLQTSLCILYSRFIFLNIVLMIIIICRNSLTSVLITIWHLSSRNTGRLGTSSLIWIACERTPMLIVSLWK